jgi:CRISPR/Cas system CSM-associated protein Csm3 (group 7 of RAMP superfamily)
MTGYPLRYVARVTIEFTTPFHVGSGRDGAVADAEVVRDVNGLPAVPGSSLAGVLRSAFLSRSDEKVCDALFGFQRDEGHGSRLRVSWGCIHDASDSPVEGMPEEASLCADPVLGNAMASAVRDHVRINDRGAADAKGRGKFDELVVCAGHRFSFELELVGTADDGDAWEILMAILASPATRLGGKTRRGLGAFKIVRLLERRFDLSDRSGREAYAAHPVRLSQPCALQAMHREAQPDVSGVVTASLSLKPEGYWMFGGGTDESGVDMAPAREARILWSAGKGAVAEDALVIPGSSVKGAIAHRVAFHHNAIVQEFADGKTRDAIEAVAGSRNKAIRQLFGYVKGEGEADGAKGEGQRGRVIIDDFFVPEEPSSQIVHHVSIDRFTGGARTGALFSERPLWQGLDWPLSVTVCEPQAISVEARKALGLALADLAGSRLALGGGTGRGNGYFTGSVRWSDQGKWAQGDQA